MKSDSTIVIGVLYGGSWYKKDDGSWKFKDYESEVTEVPQNCTLDQLNDEVYNIVNVDRDTYSLKMKFEYVLCFEPCPPVEIQQDRDVRIFLRLVKEAVPVTPLYVEILTRIDVDLTNPARCHPVDSSSGSNQYPSLRPSSPFERRMKGKEKLNVSHVVIMPEMNDQLLQDTQSSKSPIRESFAWETQVPKSLWLKTQFSNAQAPETQHALKTQMLETQFSKTKLPFRRAQQCKVVGAQFPNIRTFIDQPIGTNNSNDTNNFRSGSSRYVDIDYDSDDDDFHIGQGFVDKKELKEKLYLYAVNNNFKFKVVRSSTTRYMARCVHESCPWILRANKLPHAMKLFIIKSYFREHSCKNLSQPTDENHR